MHDTLALLLPVRESVADLLSDLLGRQVVVQRANRGLSVATPGALSVVNFAYEGGRLAAVGVADRAFGAYCGAALARLSPEQASQAASSVLDADLSQSVTEVLHVLTQLLNDRGMPTVVLRDVRHVPGQALSGDTRALVAYPAGRQNYLVDVDGYGHGKLSLLTW